MLLGTSGWGLFVVTPWVEVDLRRPDRGSFTPYRPTGKESVPQNERNQQQAMGKGIPPIDQIVPGLFDVFVFDAHDPAAALADFSAITGRAAMPPKWALGYMPSGDGAVSRGTQADTPGLVWFEVKVVVVRAKTVDVDGNTVRESLGSQHQCITVNGALDTRVETDVHRRVGGNRARKVVFGGEEIACRSIADRRRHHVVLRRAEAVGVSEIEKAIEQPVRVY